MLVILTAFTGLRWGELVVLRRDFIDLDICEIKITETTIQLDNGRLRPGTPKSRAGLRTVAFPSNSSPTWSTTSTATLNAAIMAWSSSVPRVRHFAGPTSGQSGSGHAPPPTRPATAC